MHVDAKNKTILVVDDDPDFREREQERIEAEGFKVLSASTAAEAERMLKQVTPDLMVVDLMMERMDSGFTLCYRAKKMLPEMPIIMVSAVRATTGIAFHADTPAERSWIKADAFLSKPVRFEQLVAEIDLLLSNQTT